MSHKPRAPRIAYERYLDADHDRLSAPARKEPPRYTHGQALDNRVSYLVSPNVEQAINVALAIGRPLLVKGDPGSGKTALARHVARYFGWGFEGVTVRSDTTVQDLQWTFDSVQRLNDAFAMRLGDPSGPSRVQDARPAAAASVPVSDSEGDLSRYIRPGPLWRAFWCVSPPLDVPRNAGSTSAEAGQRTLAALKAEPRSERVVLLLDEIDKADPDVPNGLLDALGNMQFRVPELEEPIAASVLPFVVLTSNGERELPVAFVRRCLVVELEAPTPERLKLIAQQHYPEVASKLLDALLERFFYMRARAGELLRLPNTAEFLDAVHACHQLRVAEGDPLWETVLSLTLWKHPKPLSSS